MFTSPGNLPSHLQSRIAVTERDLTPNPIPYWEGAFICLE